MLIILGLIVVVVGAAILHLTADRWARLAGGVLIALGLILVVIGVFNVADVNVDDADAAVKAARSSWGHALAALRP